MYIKPIDPEQLSLYLVTDRGCLGGNLFEASIAAALRAGVSFLQYREKHLTYELQLEEAKKLKELAAMHQVPFVINDSIELALAVDADGVHIGQSDMCPAEARQLLGPDKIIGVTARTVVEALKAEAEGADYLGCGAAFETGTKKDTRTIGPAGISEICAVVGVPVVAIGGIGNDNLMLLAGTGISGVAVVSAILGHPSPEMATTQLYQQVLQLKEMQTSGGSR